MLQFHCLDCEVLFEDLELTLLLLEQLLKEAILRYKQKEVSVPDFHTDILESQNTIMLSFASCFTSSKAEEWLEAVVFSFSTVADVSRSCNRTMSCKPFRPEQYKSFRPETFSFILPDTWKIPLANIQWIICIDKFGIRALRYCINYIILYYR